MRSSPGSASHHVVKDIIYDVLHLSSPAHFVTNFPATDELNIQRNKSFGREYCRYSSRLL